MRHPYPVFYKITALLSFLIFLVLTPGAQSRGRTEQGRMPPEKHAAKVRLPRGYRPFPTRVKYFRGNGINVDLFAGEFAQGAAAYAEIYIDPSAENGSLQVHRLELEKKSVPVTKMEWGYRAVMAISPETAPGIKKLKVEYSIGGAVRKEEFSFQVQSGDFLFSRRALDLGNYSDVDYRLKPEELRFIEACTGKKKKVFGTKSPDRLRASFSHPRDAHHITSPFWAKRLIMRYRKNNGKKVRFPDKINVHKGIDLRGRAGDPVYAMAGGTVAIAEPMYYEGNFVVIDHGHRMFSLYMHLGKIAVKEGASVRAGDRIGSVGSTGLSTAPHLHVSLMIQDVYVDPMSILSLPLRD